MVGITSRQNSKPSNWETEHIASFIKLVNVSNQDTLSSKFLTLSSSEIVVVVILVVIVVVVVVGTVVVDVVEVVVDVVDGGVRSIVTCLK